MFSYRHAFHAGNHADVLKHIALVACLRHLMRKDGRLTLIDTHAGAGSYRLDAPAARTSGEAQAGIARLLDWHATQAQPAGQTPDEPADALVDYLTLLARLNSGASSTPALRVYPGSPLLMHALMNEPARAAAADRLHLCELHPTDWRALKSLFRRIDAGASVQLAQHDGFERLRALLPPPASPGGSRRALALVDPSYEIKSDYAKVAQALEQALQRFATGVYLVWYPVIGRPEAHALPRRLKTLAGQAGRPWLDATLNIGAAPGQAGQAGQAGQVGLVASGMFIINPPHTLAPALQSALARVLRALGRGRGQGFKVVASQA